ncbi:MAG: DNA polymerase III subunit delta' [Pseudomonadota bacterium]
MFWLDPPKAQLEDQIARDRLAHAVLIAGGPGTGKRQLASWLVQRVLGTTEPGADTLQILAERFADVTCLTVPDDKRQIGVDQVRALSATMALSSHAGGRKIAVIEPANAMTLAAANGLLKTLEEPAGDALLILIADDLSRLPATILSRTVLLPVAVPDAASAAAWLEEQGVQPDRARAALQLTYGAPLGALALADGGELDNMLAVRRDLLGLWAGLARPLEVAVGWRKLDYDHLLATVRNSGEEVVRTVLLGQMRNRSEFDVTGVDTRDAFCYLDRVRSAIARSDVGINRDLALDALALPWAERFQGEFKQSLPFAD